MEIANEDPGRAGAIRLVGGTVVAWFSLFAVGGIVGAVQHSDPGPAAAAAGMSVGFGYLGCTLVRSGTRKIADSRSAFARRAAGGWLALNAAVGTLLLGVAILGIVAVALGRPLHGALNTPVLADSAMAWLAISGIVMLAGATWVAVILRGRRETPVESL